MRESMGRRAYFLVGAVVLLVGLLAGRAGASLARCRPDCGDADNDFAVTVTDGVAALRAAASLPATCPLEVCDTDADGTITVTDGVTILRKAASLPITGNCVVPRGFIGNDAAEFVKEVRLFLTAALKEVAAHRNQSTDETVPCDNVDGELDITVDGSEVTLSFFDCRLGDALLSGDVVSSGFGLEVSLDTGRVEGSTLTWDGTGSVVDGVSGITVNGSFEISVDVIFSDIVTFFVTLESFAISPAGQIGDGFVDLQFSDEPAEDVREVQMCFDGSNLARVVATTINAETREAMLDWTSGIFR